MSSSKQNIININKHNNEMKPHKTITSDIIIENVDAIEVYDNWEPPIVIISDGPYGVKGFKGDLNTHHKLDEWYENHIKRWSKAATPQTTLWFWNTELGWATVHPILLKHGWEFINCHTWDKGISHIAGNSNTKTLRKLPVVTEICVQYVKKPVFQSSEKTLSTKEWLRHEWERTGLPLYKTNEAAGVKNAASRKYFTKDYLWYSPPPEIFEKIVEFANKYGKSRGRPYFTLDGKKSLTAEDWEKMKAKFKCPIGITNVWQEPRLNGKERIKIGSKAVHLNQKPLKFIERIIEMSSDEGDVIWDPFGGLATTAIAANKLKRKCFVAEINPKVYHEAIERIKKIIPSSTHQLDF